MKSNTVFKKIAAGVMSAAMLFTGSALTGESGTPFFAEQTAISASAWDSHDPHNLGSTVYASQGHNKYLYPGDYLTNGSYRAILQGDGNFVIYNTQGNPRWSTNTALNDKYNNPYSGYNLAVQEDGNLVLRATPKSNGGERWIWATGTNGTKGYYTLKLESNGTLSFYKNSNASGTKVWTSTDNKVRWHIDLRKQNNQSYSSDKMYPKTYYSETIGAVGCALASTTMIYNFYKGTSVNPTALNNSTYLDNNSWLRWGNVNSRSDWDNFSYTLLAQKLKEGPVIVFVDRNPYSPHNNGHFIVVHQCTKASGTLSANDFKVLDPAYTYNGDSNMTLNQAMGQIGGYTVTQIQSWGQSAGRSMPNV